MYISRDRDSGRCVKFPEKGMNEKVHIRQEPFAKMTSINLQGVALARDVGSHLLACGETDQHAPRVERK